MLILCKKDNYKVVQKDGYYYAYDSLYSEHPTHVILSAAFEAILPDPSSFHIPLIVKFKPRANETTTIDKSLKISNADDVSYLMAKAHFKLWKLSYLLFNIIVIIGTILLSSGMVYLLTINSGLNWLLLVGTIIIYIYFIVLIIKLSRQLKLKHNKNVIMIDHTI